MLPMAQTEPLLYGNGADAVAGNSAQAALLCSPHTSESEGIEDLGDIFFNLDVSLNSYSRIESCDLQLGDTWRGMQSKMSVTAPVKKLRKKTDNKPQSQVNKCVNEKKRRELENENINQLEELLGTCLAEVKQPDKNGIVREASRQIRDVLNQRRECTCLSPVRSCATSPLQGGEISSTQPRQDIDLSTLAHIIEPVKYYINALGWVLLEINSKGEIVCITENIKDIVSLEETEVVQKSFYNFVHEEDRLRIKSLFRKLQNGSWTTEETNKIQAIPARLIKNTADTDAIRLEEVVIHATPARVSCATEAGPVMCVIRRCDDASAALLPVDGGPPAITYKQLDQITFRLDSNFKILTCDLSGVESDFEPPPSLVGTKILDLIESGDRLNFVEHLRKAVCPPAPPAILEPLRIRVAKDSCWIKVRSTSRLFKNTETEFIMSTHTILNEEDVNLIESNGNQPQVGGPLLPSVTNGESTSGLDNRYRSVSPHYLPDVFSMNELDTWNISFGDMSEEPRERQDSSSESSMTPRTPNTPSDAPPAASVEESTRLRKLLSGKKPGEGSAEGNNRILKDLLKQEDEEASSSETSAPHTPLTPHTPSAAPSPLQSVRSTGDAAPLTPLTPLTPHTPHHSHHHSSDMLLRILNDKSDENNEDGRRNSSESCRSGSQPSALLTQLLSSTNGPSSNGRSQDSDNYQERFGVKRKFDEAKSSNSSAKRATPETQQVSSSAISVASSVSSPGSCSSGGMSDLCQRNKILVALLGRQQPTPTPPLPLPNQILRPYNPRVRPTPQNVHHPPPRHHHSQLTNILTSQSRPSGVNGGTSTTEGGSHLQMVLQGVRGSYPQQSAPAPAPQPHNPHYANTAPHQVYNNHPQSGNPRQQATAVGGDNEPSDQVLSDILDEVINNMSDGERPDALMGMGANRQLRPDYPNMNEEKTVINAIRQSLMQCEKATKSPGASSPNAPPAYPVHSPQGISNMNSGMFSMGARTDSPAARAAVEQRARLLNMQRSQQMLVSPEAAEQPQQDLGSTINALVSATPPNVSLQRTPDYHHIYQHHPTNQIGSNYGTNKIPSTQQNPMLSRQLSGGYTHAPVASPAALHTPLTPHYLRTAPPRPSMGGYYEDAGGGYCAEYSRRASHLDSLAGGSAGGGGTSEYVRNELRAVVGARSARPELHGQMQPQDMDQMPMAYDMPTTGGSSPRREADCSPAWDVAHATPSTTAAAAVVVRGDAAGADSATKASLLQKLLSE